MVSHESVLKGIIAEKARFYRFDIDGALLDFVHTISGERMLLDAVIDGHRADESRPMIHLLEGNGRRPDVWLLCWRRNEIAECTEIHDHCGSKAAVVIYQGDVRELTYELETSTWNTGRSIRTAKITRILEQGSALMLDAPYIHVFEAVEGCSVSIHAYFPALDEMTLYTECDGELTPVEVWCKDGKKPERCTLQTDPLYRGIS